MLEEILMNRPLRRKSSYPISTYTRTEKIYKVEGRGELPKKTMRYKVIQKAMEKVGNQILYAIVHCTVRRFDDA